MGGNDETCDKAMVREELQKRLQKLVHELESAQAADGCYELRDYVECPPDGPPPPRQVPHPYIPGRVLYNYPSVLKTSLRVTLDGRLAQPFTPDKYYFEDSPLRVPPWSKPRYPSMELRGGSVYQGCDCWRRNGMQDDCRRWDCDGRPECSVLACPPSICPAMMGVRHRNGFESAPKTCQEEPVPFAPFPMAQVQSFTKVPVPIPPIKGVLPPDLLPCRQ